MEKSGPGPTAQVRVADALREQILGGDPEPGTPLREEELADRFQVSRHTVRSALALLAADRIVETIPYRGSRVTDLTDEQVRALQDFRCALESAAVHIAHEKYGNQWPEAVLAPIESALRALQDAEEAEDPLRITRAHVELHRTIVESSQSERIIESYTAITSEMLLFTARVRPHYAAGSLAEQHRHYLSAVQSGDGEAVWDHLRKSTELLRLHRETQRSTATTGAARH